MLGKEPLLRLASTPQSIFNVSRERPQQSQEEDPDTAHGETSMKTKVQKNQNNTRKTDLPFSKRVFQNRKIPQRTFPPPIQADTCCKNGAHRIKEVKDLHRYYASRRNELVLGRMIEEIWNDQSDRDLENVNQDSEKCVGE